MSGRTGSKDFHIRRALCLRLARKLASNARLIHELGLNGGDVRLDVAIINGRMEGYEIKADRDTLERLPRQIPAYNAVLDRCTLVVSPDHAEKAAALIPPWWGLTVAALLPDGSVRFRTIRRGSANPSLDPFVLVKLLWKQEALSIAATLRGGTEVLRSRRSEVHAFVARSLSLRRLRSAVRDHLKGRQGWRRPAVQRKRHDG